MTANEILAAACDSKIACLSDRDLLIVIAEALNQSAGGGSAPIYSAAVDIGNAAILTLPTTPVQIVPPTEILNYSGTPETLPMVDVGFLRWKNSAAVYGNIGNADMLFAWGSDFSANASVTVPWQSALNNGQFKPLSQHTGYIATTTNITDNLQDNGLFLACNNAGNFTGGDAANVLQAVLFYRVWNFVTGQFE